MARGPFCGGHFGAQRRSPDCLVAGGHHAWLLSLGLLASGVYTAHALTYRLAVPDAEHRHHVLEQTGHGYLDGPLLTSFCFALVAAGLAGRVLAGLVLQLPCALAAALAAAALLAGADALAARLGGLRRLRVLPEAAPRPVPATPGIRPADARVGARGQRAPPQSANSPTWGARTRP